MSEACVLWCETGSSVAFEGHDIKKKDAKIALAKDYGLCEPDMPKGRFCKKYIKEVWCEDRDAYVCEIVDSKTELPAKIWYFDKENP